MTRDEIEKEFELFFPIDGELSKKELVEDQILKGCAIEFAEYILRVAEQKRWQPIETAPKDGTKILLREDDYAVYRGFYFENSCWASECGQPVVYTPEPTHWQPLSESPEVKS